MDGYLKGLTGTGAIWANQKYWGHSTLPIDILAELKEAQRLILLHSVEDFILPDMYGKLTTYKF